MSPHIHIDYLISACNCPLCGAYAQLEWSKSYKYQLQNDGSIGWLERYQFAQCSHCQEHTVWLDENMIFPLTGLAPLPNPDLPDNIKEDFNEARNIVEMSPRGAVALLRLSVQKLCKSLGEKGENINSDIKNLVAKGLPDKMQKALDSVRVVGNNAVHPGQIDIKDDKQTAYKLFAFINIITDLLITQPRQIDEFYDSHIPQRDKDAIQRRDS